MKRIEWLAALVLALTLGGAAWWLGRGEAAGAMTPQVDGAGTNSFAIRDVRVFDGVGVIDNANLLVRDGRIAAVGTGVAIPDGIEVIDGRGKTVLPGLIDAHVHAWGEAQRDALRFGVSTELDMMGAAQSLPELRAQRETMTRSDRADVFSSGAALTVPHGHGTEYGFAMPELKPGDDVDAFVAARVAEGSDFIKLIVDDLHAFGGSQRMPTLDRAQIEAGIAAARRRGLLSIVHVSALDDAQHALDAGADGLAHVFVDRIADAALLASARARGAFVVPTLSVIAGFQRSGEGAALAEDARLAPRLSPAQVAMLKARFPDSFPAIPALDHALESTRRLHEAGIEILAGTDAGNPGTTHGASLHGELALLVRAGLSPRQALQAATSKPAARFGLHDRGRIAPGMRADLLLVEGDPTADIHATRAIARVWKNGYPVSAEPQAAQAAGLRESDRLVSDFEDGNLSSRFGSGWQASSDQFMGGRSKANIRWLEGGAAGSRGAMRVEGEVVAAGAQPWAGVMFSPGPAVMQPVDLAARTAITFKVRGDQGQYALVLLSGGGQPVGHPLEVTGQWREVRIALADIEGLDAAQVAAIMLTRNSPGAFEFELDDVAIE
ncbi:CIA30 family protein [Luteimonas sp. e5]